MSVFMCGGVKKSDVNCSVVGCNCPMEFMCAYPLGGEKEGCCCSRPLCDKHALVVAGVAGVHCPPHAKRARRGRD